MSTRISEEELYEKLKKAYMDLGIDETADEKAIKSKYRFLAKKYHPDANPGNKEAEEKFKAISVGYALLADEKNRRIYLKLKEKYDVKREKTSTNKAKSNSYSEKHEEYHEDTYENPYTDAPEKNNRYIFKRRDGSTIEILPIRKEEIDGQTVYEYKISQHYKDRTIINNLFGRINLDELLKNQEYCDFCVNVFLSKDNIEKTNIVYNGFLGYIEGVRKNGRNFYRIADRDEFDLFDVVADISKLKPKEDSINIDEEDINVFVEKTGSILINGKVLEQYVYYSEYLNVIDLVYSEKIDFQRYKKDPKYANAVKCLLVEERVGSKIKQGGYIGSIAYNVKTDDYDIVVDKELEKILNTKKSREK